MVKYIRGVIITTLFLCCGFFCLGSSYSYPNGGVYFDQVSYSDNIIFYGVDGLNLNYTSNMNQVGDSFQLEFDIINNSGVDMLISDFLYDQDNPYIKYSFFYVDGNPVSVGDVLKAGDVKRVCYQGEYYHPILESEYEVDSGFRIHFDQKI